MKIIFLDFDGVMNCHETLKFKKGRVFQDVFEWECSMLNPELVGRVAEIVRKTKAKIVISSAWRVGRTVKELKDILATFDFPVESIIDTTPNFKWTKWTERWIEISWWLNHTKHKVENFIILDDIRDFGPLNAHHVRTNEFEGLTEAQVKKAIRILNKRTKLKKVA